MALSTENRLALHAAFVNQIRHFIAGTILFNQSVADRVGLSLTDMQCINLLELLGPSTPGKLAASTGLTTGGVTVMLDRLEKAGLVKRQPNPKDRRSILVKVNAKKLQKVNSFYSGINQRLETFLSGRSEAEIQSVITFLSSMNAIRGERSSELK
jgi:MarR family transcriptional regulator, organic hydroperoxide resistance regulator